MRSSLNRLTSEVMMMQNWCFVVSPLNQRFLFQQETSAAATDFYKSHAMVSLKNTITNVDIYKVLLCLR